MDFITICCSYVVYIFVAFSRFVLRWFGVRFRGRPRPWHNNRRKTTQTPTSCPTRYRSYNSNIFFKRHFLKNRTKAIIESLPTIWTNNFLFIMFLSRFKRRSITRKRRLGSRRSRRTGSRYLYHSIDTWTRPLHLHMFIYVCTVSLQTTMTN